MSKYKQRQNQKKSLKIPALMLIELRLEAKRHERSMSAMIQWAWRIARARLKDIPPPPGGE
jgi:uncharacterized small protein (TIGR04563 family)